VTHDCIVNLNVTNRKARTKGLFMSNVQLMTYSMPYFCIYEFYVMIICLSVILLLYTLCNPKVSINHLCP
jgi:hypothetical protein